MRTITLVFVVMFLLGSTAIAQDQPTVSRAFILHVSPANALEFEDAYKQHIAWHGKNNDPWRWDTWERISGDELGVYVVRTPGHYWKDFDSSPLGAADREHFLKNVAAQVDSVDSTIANLLVNVSQLPEGDADLNLVSVVSFLLRPGGTEDFLHGIGKAHEAIVEAKRPVHHGWLMVMNGGFVSATVTVRTTCAAAFPAASLTS